MKISVILVVCLIVVSVSGHWRWGRRRPKPKPDCTLPVDSGKCFFWMRRWFFNTKTGTCERFRYKGCRGNSNRFKTLQQCRDTCDGQTDMGSNGRMTPNMGGGVAGTQQLQQ